MAQNVAVNGSIIVGGGVCVPASGVDQCVRQLLLGGACADGGLAYQSSIVTKVSIATAGNVGDAFVALAALAQFSSIEFLFLQASARMRLRWTVPGPTVIVSPDLEGLQIYQFSRAPNAPTLIEASGVATLDIIAAGVPA